MTFAVGDRVHLPRVGTGVVVEIRNGGRLRVEIKGRTMIVDEGQLERAHATRASTASEPDERSERRSGERVRPQGSPRGEAPRMRIDLHGLTVAEAIDALDAFLNDALLAGLPEVRVVHGRSGGKIRDAVHQRLRAIAAVRAFRIDPRNAGVTIVSL